MNPLLLRRRMMMALLAQQGGSGGEEPMDELEFYDSIMSDGVAYIDTGKALGTSQYANSSMHFELTQTAKGNTPNHYFFGAYINNNRRWLGLSAQLYNRIVLSYFSNKIVNVVTTKYGTRYSIDAIYGDGIYLNDIRVADLPEELTTEPTNTALIFARNGSPMSVVSNVVKFHRISMTAPNGEKHFDFVPCKYNGIPGMWDLVEQKFYGNANTEGSFTVSNDEV